MPTQNKRMPRRPRSGVSSAMASSIGYMPSKQPVRLFQPTQQTPMDIQLQTLDSAHMRAQNSSLILRLIWGTQSISRAEIARRTGLSRSTVSAIVNQFLDGGIVIEFGAGDSLGGRRPIILSMNEGQFALIGLDIGASHIGVAMTDLRGKVKVWEQRRYAVQTDPEGTFALIGTLVDGCLQTAKREGYRLLGIGVAVASPVHPKQPEYVSEVVMPAWAGYSVPERLRKRYNVPIYMDNDANLGALAELWWGAGRDGADLAYIKVGTGVGAGFIINGNIYRGWEGFAGEIGHLVIEASTSRSSRGLQGCLTAFVGAEALEKRAITHYDARAPGLARPRPVTIGGIADAALAGDPAALEVIQEAGHYLGVAVANLLNLFNPATVVFGGAITKAGDLLIDSIRNTVRAFTLWDPVSKSRLATSELGEHSVAIGAATMVLKAALDDPSLFPSFDNLASVH